MDFDFPRTLWIVDLNHKFGFWFFVCWFFLFCKRWEFFSVNFCVAQIRRGTSLVDFPYFAFHEFMTLWAFLWFLANLIMFNNRFRSNYRNVAMLIILFSVSIANDKLSQRTHKHCKIQLWLKKNLFYDDWMLMMLKNIPARWETQRWFGLWKKQLPALLVPG